MMNDSLDSQMDLSIELIKQSKNIYIGSHIQPDGDNIGSILALGLALKKIRKEVFIVKVDEIPSDYTFLPSIDMIKDYDEKDNFIDLFIALDASDLDRLGSKKTMVLKANKVLNIDHHKSNTYFGDINIVSENSSATGELIYRLIEKMGIELDKDIATCIYTAISTDTGSFMYDSTTYETHEIVAKLLKTGIDKNNININLYQNRSLERTKLFIKALDGLETYFDNKVAIVKVTQELLEESKTKMEDTEGIVSFIRDIAPVEVACLLKEFEKNQIKISVRSKRYIDVSQICEKFNGGGHKRAAGCTIYGDVEKAKELILEEIKESFR